MKCNERTVQEEEIRMLRQQVRQSDDYRAIIAKKDAEIHVRDDLLAYRKEKAMQIFFFLVETSRTIKLI